MEMEYGTEHLEEGSHMEAIVELEDNAQTKTDAELEDNEDQIEEGTMKQSRYIKKVILKFNMEDAKSSSNLLGGKSALFFFFKEECSDSSKEKEEMKDVPYALVLRCLMYMMVSTRLDIVHTISILSQFMSNPSIEHWKALERLLIYLKGTWDYGMSYEKAKGELVLKGFVNADYASNRDTNRSTTSYIS
uniref:Retrovirus-related Pol polyprotein from transposon TNT 1-94 n=1 Tax=Cannabis sativa TaxID=3483 RepID=A0A803P4N8_CANSA